MIIVKTIAYIYMICIDHAYICIVGIYMLWMVWTS